MSKYLIDPPSGWKYGFPKEYTGDIETIDMSTFLLQNGYPEEEIQYWGKDFHVRVIKLD